MAERWITWKGRHILVDDDGNIIKKEKKEKIINKLNVLNFTNVKEIEDKLGYIPESILVGSKKIEYNYDKDRKEYFYNAGNLGRLSISEYVNYFGGIDDEIKIKNKKRK